jgi:DNA-directed RNA polymerase specialized sigma24 family protein
MNWLEKVAEYHADYIRIVHSYGETEYAEDIVQEMYVRLDKYADASKIIRKDGTLNKAYIFFTLRNIFKSLCMERQKHKKVDLEEIKHLSVEYDYISKHEAQSILEARIDEETDSWHWYDQMLFKNYRDNEWSFRQAAKETNIGYVSIFRTIKYCKERLKENVSEHYEDYINEDYEKI